MEDKELCCICLDYTIDFDTINLDTINLDIKDLDLDIKDLDTINLDIKDLDTINLDIKDLDTINLDKSNSSNYKVYKVYKVLNCCSNTIHKYCLLILFLYGYEDCPLCRCNICINDYFTLDDFHDFYLYSKTSKVGKTSNILNNLLWKLCNSNYYYYYYYYYKTMFSGTLPMTFCQGTLPMTFCQGTLPMTFCQGTLPMTFYQGSYLRKVICIMLIIVCFYFLLFYTCTLLY